MWHNINNMGNTDDPDIEMTQNPEINATLETNDGEPSLVANDKYDVLAMGDEYADSENKKWPLDAEHIKPALSYYNGAKNRDGNSEAKWQSIGHKIAAFATSHYGVKYSLINGNVVKEKAASDIHLPLNVCPGCKNGGCTGSYCPHCGTSLRPATDEAPASLDPSASTDPVAIIPGNSTNAVEGSCPSCYALNQLEKFCTVCGHNIVVIPDTTLPISVGVSNNNSTAPEYLSIGSPSAVVDEDGYVIVEEEFVPGVDEWLLVTDAKTTKSGVLGRVRQLAMVVDSVNKNNRLYPRKVVNDALADTEKRIGMGLVHSEYHHPSIASDRGRQVFVDNHDKKTSNIVKVERPNTTGQVFVTRDILDTPHGREVYDDFKKGKPKGISTRMLMKAHDASLNGKSILVADEMKIPTWDDMGIGDSPAVPETREHYQMLTDAELTNLGLEPVVDSSNTVNAVNEKGTNQMNEDIQAALDDYAELSLDRQVEQAKVDSARTKVVDEIKRAKSKKQINHNQFVECMKALTDTDGLFGGGRDQPTIVDGKAISAPTYNGAGYAKDLTLLSTPAEPDQAKNEPTPVLSDPAEVKAEMDSDEKKLLTELLAERKAKEAAQAVSDAVDAKELPADLPADVKERILATAKKTAKNVAAVDVVIEALLDNYSEAAAQAKLNAMGHGVKPTSFTVSDPYSGGSTVVTSKEEKPAYWAGVDELCGRVDAIAKKQDPKYRFDDEAKAVRAYNRKNWIDPLIERVDKARAVSNSPEQFAALMDKISHSSPAETGAFQSLIAGKDVAVSDATVLSNYYNQPTVSTAVLVQSYQDLTALSVVDPIGPSTGSTDPLWTSIPTGQNGMPGWILRVPSETYTDPSGVGTVAVRSSFGTFDAGLLTADNAGIPEGTINVAWQAFPTLPRNIGFSVTRGTSRAAGLGPLNLDIIARSMYHSVYKKNRVLDTALYNDMLQASDTYNSVSITSETVNNTYNSVYNAAGSVTVNLNPKKAASATPAAATSTTAADPYITYGANVIAAVRVAGPATPGASGATVYSGTSYGISPIVKSKYTADLTAAGAYNTTYTYPVTVSSPASSVEGYLDANKQVQSKPTDWFGTYGTATFAVDHEVGVIAFNSVAPPSGTGSLITSAVTVSYYYATNFQNITCIAGGPIDQFALLGSNDIYQLLGANGVLPEQYLNSVLREIDLVATTMSSNPTYMQPNILLGSMLASNTILPASLFYKLNSPTGTALFPEDQPTAYFERNGILGCRHNTPWQVGNHRFFLSRKGSTKYGISQPAQFFGPYPKYDANGNLIANDAYYLEEYSTIATPYITDASGKLYNVPSSSIIFRSANG